jgi:hypothetical protein
MGILRMILTFLKAFFACRADLVAENLLLRQQLIVLQQSVPRLNLRQTDRILLCWLSRLWTRAVPPENLVRIDSKAIAMIARGKPLK